MSKINAKTIQIYLPTILPSIDFQNMFAFISKKNEKINVQYKPSFTELKIFYCALSQKAFQGEQDLSKVVYALD